MEQTTHINTELNNEAQNQLPKIYLVDKKKKSRYQIKIKSFLVVILFIVLILLELFHNGSYLDEVIGILSIAYLIVYNRKINKYDIITFVILLGISAWGLISNAYSGVSVTIRSIGIDAVTQVKVLASFFFMKYFITNEEKQNVIEIFVPLAKLFTVIAFVCSILSQFVDLGMTRSERYGLKCFDFIFAFNFQYIATFLLLLGSIVCSKKMSPKKKNKFYVMAIIAIALDLRSQALLFSAIFVFLIIVMKRYRKLNLVSLLVLGGIVLFLSQYQIDTYLAKEDTARHVFYEYAIKNANSFFPFGSGYATYGSAEASKNYSPLYFLYDFDEVWGMSPDFRPFLTDTYWASVLGQFGWIGAGAMVLVYYRVLRSMTNANFTLEQRAFLYSAFAQYVIHAIGSGIITSSPGLIGFMAMALFTPNDEAMNRSSMLKKIKITI